jgi:hypothetical protein
MVDFNLEYKYFVTGLRCMTFLVTMARAGADPSLSEEAAEITALQGVNQRSFTNTTTAKNLDFNAW